MRVSEMGLRVLDLGTPVTYTHRATSTSPDGPRDASLMRTHRGRYPAEQIVADRAAVSRIPDRFRSERQKPARWVFVWPEVGSGIVVGITRRDEGIVHLGSEDEQSYLGIAEGWPLYQVRARLNGPTILVPPWACVPWPPAPWSVDLFINDGDVPEAIMLGGSRQPWASWVERVVARKRIPA